MKFKLLPFELKYVKISNLHPGIFMNVYVAFYDVPDYFTENKL